MKSLKTIIIIILILLLGYFIYDKLTQEKEIIEVPVKIKVPVPSKEGSSDTIYIPKPYKVINPINDSLKNKINQLSKKNKILNKENNKLITKFNKVNDSLKNQMYKDAISIKEYNKSYEDSIQTIDVYSKTRGSLLEQSISYKTKKYNLPIDTSITTKRKNKFKVFGLIEGGTNIFDNNRFNKFVGKGTIIFKNSKDNAISISADTKGYGYLGYMFKF